MLSCQCNAVDCFVWYALNCLLTICLVLYCGISIVACMSGSVEVTLVFQIFIVIFNFNGLYSSLADSGDGV
jgi:hypothetical protein